jgi:hypothetical protein
VKIFISYAFTGESEPAVAARLTAVQSTLEKAGHQAYCFHFDPVRTPDMSEAECIAIALDKMVGNDVVLALGVSERRSEGMLLEIGASLVRNMPVVYAQNVSAVGTSYLPSLADYTFVWCDENELLQRLREYFGENDNE